MTSNKIKNILSILLPGAGCRVIECIILNPILEERSVALERGSLSLQRSEVRGYGTETICGVLFIYLN